MPSESINRLFGLVGKDIDYSFSRNYFATKFAQEQLQNCVYQNFDLSTISEIESVFEQKNLCGLNVTIPYKQEVISYLDELSEEATAIGAVNTVFFSSDGKKIGHNTDAYGFEKALREVVKEWPQGALILGSGGAALAIQFVLERNGTHTTCVSRNPKSNQYGYEALDAKIISKNQLIVNATPLGTFPNVEKHPPFPYELLTDQHFLFDLIYNPKQTTFLKKGLFQAAGISNGYQMLVHQADKSWELWNQ